MDRVIVDKIKSIEQLPNVVEAAAVLRELEHKGLREAAIAAGWTRSLVAGGSTNDIDVSYVGNIHYEIAQKILAETLDELQPSNKAMWDVKGIWNAQIAYGVRHSVDNFLLYYLNSIDSIYLASDGRLHDSTGYGFKDAHTQTLRINNYDINDRKTTPSEEVNVCLENCRRIAKFHWTPTSSTANRLRKGVGRWRELTQDEINYFVEKLKTKYHEDERQDAQKIYSQFGWGFIFDL